MYSLKASTKTCSTSLRSTCTPSAPLRLKGARVITVRAVEEEKAPAAEVDYSAKANEALTKATEYVQTVWDETADAEKPAAIAIICAAIVAQIAIGATMDAVDRLPFFGDALELIGVAVTATFVYRYVTDPTERANAKATVDGVISNITGKK